MAVIRDEERVIKIVVVDDHALVRGGILRAISKRQDLMVVGEGCCGDDVFALVKQHSPDVLILDLRMPQYNNQDDSPRFDVLNALRLLQQNHPNTQVIIVSQYINQIFVQAAVQYGVRSYLLKGDNLSLNMIEAIDVVLSGETFFSHQVNDALVAALPADNNDGARLTKRQIEIINLLVRCPEMQNIEVAAELNIAPSTLKGYFKNLFTMFDVPNRRALVMRALELGLVDLYVGDRGRVMD
jgi:DNA-binding NarL/FixJ family response regulator